METYVFNSLAFLWQIYFHTFSKFITMPCGGIKLWENFLAHVAHGYLHNSMRLVVLRKPMSWRMDVNLPELVYQTNMIMETKDNIKWLW
jgi:hypothetical protein